MNLKKNKLRIIAEFEDSEVLNEETKNILLITDKNILTTMDFNDSFESLALLIGSLLVDFGINEEGVDKETFFLNQLNKIKLKNVLSEFLYDLQDYLEEKFDNKFMEVGLEKNKFYIDIEKWIEEKLNNFNKNNNDEEE